MLANLIVIAIVGGLLYLAIHKIRSDRKKGIGSCGLNCSACAGHCHSGKEIPERFRAKKPQV